MKFNTKEALILLLLFLTIPCMGQYKEDIYYPVEKMPSFPGGEMEMYKFMKEKLTYPRDALMKRIEGRVTIRFIVLRSGHISDIYVIRGIDPECDSLAVKIVRSMPKWTSGSIMGKVKDTDFTLPIIFRLPEYEIVEGEQIYLKPDTAASFPEKEYAMFKFIGKNLKYPSLEAHIQGRIIIRFIVTKEGKIKSPVVIQKLDKEFDKEALRVISIMPNWIPAKQNGETVSAYYTLPIIYKIKQ